MADPGLDDGTLERFRRGDPEAQRRVFLHYKNRVFSIALQFLRGDDALAQDVTQEVFVKVFRTASSFRNDSRLSTWIYRIVANSCTDELRRSRRLIFFGDLPSHLHPAVAPRSGEPDADVKAAVGRLSPPLRMAVLLRYFDDLTYEEIAEALGVSPGTVASRLSRAHRVLARELAHLDASGVLLAGGRP